MPPQQRSRNQAPGRETRDCSALTFTDPAGGPPEGTRLLKHVARRFKLVDVDDIVPFAVRRCRPDL